MWFVERWQQRRTSWKLLCAVDSSQSDSVQSLSEPVKFSVLWFSKPKRVRHIQTSILVYCTPQIPVTSPGFYPMNVQDPKGLFSMCVCGGAAHLSHVKPHAAMLEVDNHLSIGQGLRFAAFLLVRTSAAAWASATPNEDKHFLPLKPHLNFPQCRPTVCLSTMNWNVALPTQSLFWLLSQSILITLAHSIV